MNRQRPRLQKWSMAVGLLLARISHKHSATSPQVLGLLRQTAHFDPQSICNAIPVEMLALFQETGLHAKRLRPFVTKSVRNAG
jgi:hypothetical protein